MTTEPNQKMTEVERTRLHFYVPNEQSEKFKAIKVYLEDNHITLNRTRNNSRTLAILIETFYELFIEDNDQSYHVKMAEFKNGTRVVEDKFNSLSKKILRQLDVLQYLELTNFHATTKGSDFDIQDLESLHSKIDPSQHELLARIEELMKEDIARGQTQKHSH